MRISTLILIFLLFFSSICFGREKDEKHNVLVIHSYHKEMQWVDEMERGIEATLLDALGTSVDIRVEYMDSKRYSEEEYYQLLTSVWRYKYLTNRPDCLIVCDDNALNLLLSIRDELFRGIPIVFCGINYYDREKFSHIENITGVIEAYDLPGTLNIIKTLLPSYRDLYIINDTTLTGVANKARIEEVAYLFSDHFTFTYSGNLSLDILTSVTQSLPKTSAILLMSFNRDADNRIYRYRDAIKAIRSNSSSPIFGVWSFYLGRGLLGGSLVNGESQGKTAAELALKILAGTPASALPVIEESPNLPMFDYEELQRFGIKESLLPPGSTVINTPDLLWYRHKYKVIGVIFLFGVQIFIIALLMKNIRQRKESENTLRKNEQNLSTTLEAIGEAVISIDTDYRIISANSQAGLLLNIPGERLPASSLPELLLASDPVNGQALVELVRKCCTIGTLQELPEETIFHLPDQPLRYLSGSCSPIRNTQHEIQGAVLVCHDITEKHNIQNMLAQSRKMEAIGQLAGGVAHDFNNLLTGISGFAELLTIRLSPDSPEHHYAAKVLQAATRAADLTRQMLSFARKGKVLSSAVDCHISLQSAIDLLSHSLDKSISIISHLDAQHSIIIGDPTQLENIFLNLAINSADAMPDGGSITITTENIEQHQAETCEFGEILEPGSYICVRFADTGSGIDVTMREKIFEPFFTTKAQGKGTGLGLAAVFGAMKEHNGRIRLKTELGIGTEFLLYFPIERMLRPEGKSQQIIPTGDGATILVIDDERLILASAKELLNELGYSVLLAEGPTAGISTYRRYHKEIDLVLLDMIMPEMNGTACFKQLLEIDEHVRALICSGFTKNEKFAEAEKLGVRGFVQKPFSGSELSSAIRNALSLSE